MLFGDQLASKTLAVDRLYELAKTSPRLQAFLREATDVLQCLREEYLKPSERHLYGDFNDIRDLCRRHEANEHVNEAVGTTLITIIQVGEVLLYVSIHSCMHPCMPPSDS